MRADIAVVGAGPAGCAAAMTLRRYLPELAVALVAAPPAQAPAVGEVLSPGVMPLLHYLGMAPRQGLAMHLPSAGTASAWGSPAVQQRHNLFSGQGNGLHLDRGRFNAWLLEQARAAGACVIEAVTKAERGNAGWHLPGAGIEATSLIDATGRSGRIARQHGAVSDWHDALVAEAEWYVTDAPQAGHAVALIEAAPDGWWYSAELPDQRGVAMFMTDSDLLRQGLRDERLALAPATAERLARWRCLGVQAVRPAGTVVTRPALGDGWVAAGDAALAFDPLSSLGIGFALRSGIEAARVAAADCEGDSSPRQAYLESLARIHADYGARLRSIYRQERRWSESAFWARRLA